DGPAMSDAKVLDMVAEVAGIDLGTRTVTDTYAELAEFPGWDGPRHEAPAVEAGPLPEPGAGNAVLATWRLMLDAGRGQDGEPHLAGTAHRPVAMLSAATAAEAGVQAGDSVVVSSPTGSLELPVVLAAMPDGVVWLPQHSRGSSVYRSLGVGAGAVVALAPADSEVQS
ncbi:MAG TPA: molybdopterin dinucleotide binding domain-containing protein, partial [Ruania sp.]|nr:molybdopterin dinucleotide binding domain-containing protein [Ruania sp.]